MVSITVQTADEKVFKIPIDDQMTFVDFRIAVANQSLVPENQIRLFFRGHSLDNDVGFTMCKITRNAHVLLSRKRLSHEQQPAVFTSRTLVMVKFKMAWVLMNNCEKCLEAFEKNIPPGQRERVDSPIDMSNAGRPMATDLGELADRISIVFQKYGDLVEEVGSDMINLDHEDLTDAKKCKTQLLMDCSRYLAVICGIMANFIIPLYQEPPRYIQYRQTPQSRRN